VTPDDYEEALGVFKKAAEEILPEEGRGLEMARLFGEAGSEVPARAGALEWLLREEIARGPLRVRRVEHPFQGSFVLPAGSGDADVFELSVRGRADRVDIDVSGGLHVLDYKTGRAPEARLALQVPLYALCLERVFGAPAVEASYVSLEQRKAKTIRMHPFATAVQTRDLRDAVTAGRFPPRPYHDHLCHSCGYLVLCRKEIREGT
jgi:CRISPR/Cas system-associated exonuclease Cas4 (RecB family)